MNEEKIKSFLADVKPIVEENERLRKEKEQKGDFFNIFSILKAETDEVKTHSAFLAELLNPKGTHGQGALFLDNFLKIIAPNEDLITENAEVDVEFSIGAVSKDYKSGGRLDILIRLPESNYIILIENKIDAGDQPCQLLRYNKYAKETKCKYKLLYLTKDGHNPSKTSTRKSSEEPFWKCISYSQDIKNWLKICLENIANASPVVETIRQYIGLIDKITNQTMEIKMSEQLTELMIKNFDETLAVLENGNNFDIEVYEKFKTQMSELKCEKESKTNIFTDYGKQWINFIPDNCPKDCTIVFGREKNSCIFLSIKKTNIKSYQQQLTCFDHAHEKNYPYGWKNFKYQDWNSETKRAILNGELKAYVKECIEKIINDPNFPK
ncbi:MAG: PD-(D/E)XK nuclease family protein [Spirochaetia bacterium]|nr:PD-(D/E)XK nuclease family protein [Spirochaetia bacterium]